MSSPAHEDATTQHTRHPTHERSTTTQHTRHTTHERSTTTQHTRHTTHERATADADERRKRSFSKPASGHIAILAVALIGLLALFTKDQWSWLLQDSEPKTEGVFAAPLEDVRASEKLYRISPDNGSTFRYEVQEQVAGASRTVVGSTGVATGEVAVDTADLSMSRLGEIVVNVETLESDSVLRDKRIRHDFLESSHWPFVRFAPKSVDIPVDVESDFSQGSSYPIEITGDLTVKRTTRTQTFKGTFTVHEDHLTADMSTTLLSSDYGIGPIHIARLVHTSDEVFLALKLIANRVQPAPATGDRFASDVTPGSSLQPAIPAPVVSRGEFAATVQPILETHCVSCHTSEGSGSATIALNTAVDAAEIASDIAFVTKLKFMPPWLPSDLSPEFEHDWSMSDEDRNTLTEWAATGGGIDVPPDTPLVPRSQAIIPIEEDHVIDPRDGPYTGHADADGMPLRKDDYRCQVYAVADPEGDGTWVDGFEFRPDQTSVVHHSVVYMAPAAAAKEIADKIAAEDRFEAAEGRSDQPGWTCFGLSGLNTEGVQFIQGWAPGMPPTVYPEGHGLYLAPGDMIVNQIHYHYDHDIPTDNSQIVLDTADAEKVAAGIKQIATHAYVTPAEVPCTPAEKALAEQRASSVDGYTNMCVRSNVLTDIAKKYDPFASTIPDLLLLQCGGTVDDYDDLDGSVGYSSCDLSAQHTGIIHTVFGHMHEFGASYRMTLHPDTPEERILLDIPVWDFEWQLAYDPVEDIRIERGDTVRFECRWDRKLQYMPEPRYIVWNEGTGDEMCFSAITVMPD